MFESFFSFLSFKESPQRNQISAPDPVEIDSDDRGNEIEAPVLRVSEYTHGQELSGWVLKVNDGGIVVSLPNTETGLVLRDEVSWRGYPKKFKKGDWVDVVVMAFKPEKGLFLSIRRANSAERIKAVYETVTVGAVLSGKIKSVKDYGVFVSVGPGVEGLCHVSHITDISAFDKHAIGQDVKVRVLEFIEAEDRIQLEFV